jgi:release factor glutamine methyltransferase
VRVGDLLEPVQADGPFDLIASNPPYIPTGDVPSLPPEVRKEPMLALDGGPDGLAVIDRLVPAAFALLAPGGALVLELGAGQAPAVQERLRQAGFVEVGVRADLAQIDRVVFGRRPTSPT